MNKKISALMVALALLPTVSYSGLDDGDVVDKCVRTFVLPKRIVWKSTQSDRDYVARCSITDEDVLLGEKKGQIPETSDYYNKIRGCMLDNRGNVPSIIIDFGKEIHGGLQLGMSARTTRGQKLRIRFGESVSETCTDAGEGDCGAGNDHAIRDQIVAVPAMGTTEIGNTGFRFVRVDLITFGKADFESIRAIELKRPMVRLGDFKSSDERLNQIWDVAVRTVHLCCQNYIWDGIKRDRLVWMGDTHPETMSVLNVFGDNSVIPDSLDYMAATTDAKTEWMNCMGPYTLWWIRNFTEWYRYTGDRSYLAKHATYVSDTLNRLATFVTPSNTFEGVRRPFLDWPTEHNRPAVFAGMQALAVITFREGAFLADEMQNAELAKVCRAAERKLMSQKTPDANGAKSAAAMLALAGFRDPKDIFAETLGCDGHANVSTFYGYYMLEAMSAAGENERAVSTVRDYWGGMLDVGATSFWENFNLDWTNNCFRIDEMPVAGKKDIHGDYGEFCYPGFRHSFCHGWGCGPAAWLINHVLGIRPVGVGCKTVEVKPFLGSLEWAEGAMALPGGRVVKVRVTKNADGSLNTAIDAPPDVKIIR